MLELLCMLPLAGTLFTACAPPPPLAVGYVEGEYVLIAPIETAQVMTVTVRRGDRVLPGDPLVTLETRDAEIQVAQADAALAEAREAERIWDRQSRLRERGIASQASFDDAATNLELARAKVKELEASLSAARLPARPDEIMAATAAVDRARANVDNAAWRLSKRTLAHHRAGTVSDIIRNPGEVAGPQAPVLSLLPDGAVKLRLYVPEPTLSSVAAGAALTVRCDGCAEGLSAIVTYVASKPEFTPPVIYSLENRQKLVYLIEARPEPGPVVLKPGQIVDVDLAGGAS